MFFTLMLFLLYSQSRSFLEPFIGVGKIEFCCHKDEGQSPNTYSLGQGIR